MHLENKSSANNGQRKTQLENCRNPSLKDCGNRWNQIMVCGVPVTLGGCICLTASCYTRDWLKRPSFFTNCTHRESKAHFSPWIHSREERRDIAFPPWDILSPSGRPSYYVVWPLFHNVNYMSPGTWDRLPNDPWQIERIINDLWMIYVSDIETEYVGTAKMHCSSLRQHIIQKRKIQFQFVFSTSLFA